MSLYINKSSGKQELPKNEGISFLKISYTRNYRQEQKWSIETKAYFKSTSRNKNQFLVLMIWKSFKRYFAKVLNLDTVKSWLWVQGLY